MFTGLFISALINILLGFTTAFWFFLILWTLNGWVQSMDAPSSVVTISHWCNKKERGTFYGMWGSSHNIGEAITFVVIAIVISSLGWEYGFRIAGFLSILMSLIILKFLYESPESQGFPSVICELKNNKENKSIGAKQWEVFKSPALQILALSSAFIYVTRYAGNSWGIFFLEAEKGYTTVEASFVVSASAVAGILGTFFSGIISDKFFKSRRNVPALLFGILYTLSITVFVLSPANLYIDVASMVVFGVALGVLLVYLGGLIAVDICSKETSGTALGIIGVSSYIGAGIQDIVSGYLIEGSIVGVDNVTSYNFDTVGYLWIGSALISTILATLIWNKTSNEE